MQDLVDRCADCRCKAEGTRAPEDAQVVQSERLSLGRKDVRNGCSSGTPGGRYSLIESRKHIVFAQAKPRASRIFEENTYRAEVDIAYHRCNDDVQGVGTGNVAPAQREYGTFLRGILENTVLSGK